MRSNLSRLYPFVDSKGVLHVRRRLEQVDEPDAVKYPVIHLSNNRVTSLIIRHFHWKSSIKTRVLHSLRYDPMAFGSSVGCHLLMRLLHRVSRVVNFVVQCASERCPTFRKTVLNVVHPLLTVASIISAHS